MSEAHTSSGGSTRSKLQLTGAVTCALFVAWLISIASDIVYQPQELDSSVYYIDYPERAAVEASPPYDPANLQRGWPFPMETVPTSQKTMISYMTELRDHPTDTPIAKAPEPADGAAPAPKVIVPEPDLATLLADADITAGAKVARKCLSCHTFKEGGRNSTGPNLWGIVDGEKAKVSGFKYSTAMTVFGGTWDAVSLYAYLRRPARYIRGTRMAFAGLRKSQDRANLIAYMQSMGGGSLTVSDASE